MTYKLNIGRHQMAIRLRRKPGRPKKPVFLQVKDRASPLFKIAQNKRYAGSPATRVLRKILENKKTRKIFGANLTVFALLTSSLAPSISAFSDSAETEITTLSQTVIQITTENSVQAPLDSFVVSQGYHYFHRAIDLTEAAGTPVYPIMEGVVRQSIYSRSGYGNYVIIDHGSGFESLYAHLGKIVVKQGEAVDKDTVLGTVGNSGRATGTHLHLEVYDHDQTFNPLTILPQ